MIHPSLAIQHLATHFSSKKRTPFLLFGAISVFHSPLSPFLPLLIAFLGGELPTGGNCVLQNCTHFSAEFHLSFIEPKKLHYPTYFVVKIDCLKELPGAAVVAAGVAGVAVAADLAATIQMSHLCGVKKLFLTFFCFYVSIFFDI